jgi:hypothetical protein
MHDVDGIINEATDAREVKRAVSVKMGQQGFSLGCLKRCSDFSRFLALR